MIFGAKYWDATGMFYSQENNPTEAYNKIRLSEKKRDYWMETCGPTSAVNCIAATEGVKNLEIVTPGGYVPQPEELLMDYMTDPRNVTKLNKVRDLEGANIPGNRVPQYYPLAVKEVFGVKAQFKWGLTLQTLVKDLKQGWAVQVCLLDPGHYLAVVAYDASTHELIYHDSWISRYIDNNGRMRRISAVDLLSNTQPFRIVYGV